VSNTYPFDTNRASRMQRLLNALEDFASAKLGRIAPAKNLSFGTVRGWEDRIDDLATQLRGKVLWIAFQQLADATTAAPPILPYPVANAQQPHRVGCPVIFGRDDCRCEEIAAALAPATPPNLEVKPRLLAAAKRVASCTAGYHDDNCVHPAGPSIDRCPCSDAKAWQELQAAIREAEHD
jgi:hypothetical protein